MCFAPQRRSLFRRLNFQKCSEPGVFCTFWLGNVLRATAAYTFSTSRLPKLLTSTGASGHNGVQLFISHLARWLRTRRFREPTFQPSRATNHSKNTVCRPFATLSRTCIFFPPTLSLLWSSFLFSSLLSSPLLSSSLLFSSLLWLFPPLLFHFFVGSLTSKLSSINHPAIGDPPCMENPICLV